MSGSAPSVRGVLACRTGGGRISAPHGLDLHLVDAAEPSGGVVAVRGRDALTAPHRRASTSPTSPRRLHGV